MHTEQEPDTGRACEDGEIGPCPEWVEFFEEIAGFVVAGLGEALPFAGEDEELVEDGDQQRKLGRLDLLHVDVVVAGHHFAVQGTHEHRGADGVVDDGGAPGVALESVEFDHFRVHAQERDSSSCRFGEQGADHRCLAAARGSDDQAVRFVRLGGDVPEHVHLRCCRRVGQVAQVLVDEFERVIDAGR